MKKSTSERKKESEDPVDPAFLACFDAAMLDYDILEKQVEDKGMRLKHHNDYKTLKESGRWEARWLLENYTAVTCKMSRLSRRMRDFVEYIGDNAAMLWADNERKAMERTAPPEPSKEAVSPIG